MKRAAPIAQPRGQQRETGIEHASRADTARAARTHRKAAQRARDTHGRAAHGSTGPPPGDVTPRAGHWWGGLERYLQRTCPEDSFVGSTCGLDGGVVGGEGAAPAGDAGPIWSCDSTATCVLGGQGLCVWGHMDGRRRCCRL